MKRRIIIGSRGSELALWQSKEVQRLLRVETEIKIIKTAGDRFLDVPLQGQMEKGFFTKEIEELMIGREIDLAVHSLKDLPTEVDPRLTIAACLKRGPLSDLLLARPEWHDENSLFPVKPGCLVGATSLRRQAMLKYFSPGSHPAMLRGNVPTRVRKCQEGQYGAIILARAGVERLDLDLEPLIVYELNPEIWLPAPGQGVVAVEARADDNEILNLLASLDDKATRDAAFLERRLLANFEGGCHTAFGACAHRNGNEWSIKIGIERKETAWAEISRSGPYEQCLCFGPETLKDFSGREIKSREELCRPLR
jgi:hydroxymethylbilane synthase